MKEHLAGFYLVECADIDEAIGIAARVPDAEFNHVQVRPVFDRSMLDEWTRDVDGGLPTVRREAW